MLIKYDVYHSEKVGQPTITYFINDKYISFISREEHEEYLTISLIKNEETKKMFNDEYIICNVSNVSYLMSPSETVETPQVPQVVTQSVITDEIEDELKKLNETFSFNSYKGTEGAMYNVLTNISGHLRKLNKLLKKHFN